MDLQQQSYVPNQSNSIAYRRTESRADTAHQYFTCPQARLLLAQTDFGRFLNDDAVIVSFSELGAVIVSLLLDQLEELFRLGAHVGITDVELVQVAAKRVLIAYPQFQK